MALGVLIEDNMQNNYNVHLTVYRDSVRLEIEQYGRKTVCGWYENEVEATAAACERTIMQSAILPDRRRLPGITITSVYLDVSSEHEAQTWHRGIACKRGELGRRYVLLPGASGRPWLGCA